MVDTTAAVASYTVGSRQGVTLQSGVSKANRCVADNKVGNETLLFKRTLIQRVQVGVNDTLTRSFGRW